MLSFSARLAGAPMDAILLSADMPRTLYQNNDVPPRAHIIRSLGGPIFSLIGTALSLFWRSRAPRKSLSRELAETSLIGHSIIMLGSITPVPIVDGGVILKWKLIKAGKTAENAERMVKRTNLFLGTFLMCLGIILGFLYKRRVIGGLFVAGGAAGIAASEGWLK